MLVLSVFSAAIAGYGDAVDGVPSHPEREVHFWTNAIRTAPDAFVDDYPCSFSSFASSEKTPKSLLWWNADLGAAARYHSADMDEQGYFDHDSIDGTSWSSRIYRFYDGFTIGENIAAGYGTAGSAVFDGWMCSAGHRSNIMSAGFNELGDGVAGTYYTQDFGLGSPPTRILGMGLHLPERPQADLDLAVVLEAPAEPDAVYAVLDGERVDLASVIGDPRLGVWASEVTVTAGCHEYYFVAEMQVNGEDYLETFPEQGSYGWGPCTFDDPEAGWLSSQLPLPSAETAPTGTGGTEPTDPNQPGDPADPGDPGATGEVPPPAGSGGCGCSATPSPSWWLWPAGLLLVARRRRS